MSGSNEVMAAAQAALERSRGGVVAGASTNDRLVRGAALGALASIPFAGIGLVGGAVIGAGVAALDSLARD